MCSDNTRSVWVACVATIQWQAKLAHVMCSYYSKTRTLKLVMCSDSTLGRV